MPSRILIVDDEESIRSSLRKLLEYHGYETYLAEDGFRALEILGDKPMDVVLLDIKMPRMDGVQLLEELRVRTRLQTIPAVILTSSQDGQDIKRAYAAGANAYLVKPVSFTEFNQQVELLIKFWMEMNQTVSLL